MMILAQITVERLSGTDVEHKLLNTKEELAALERRLEETKKQIYSDSYFVGRYSYEVEELDVDTVLLSDLKLPIKEFRRLLDDGKPSFAKEVPLNQKDSVQKDREEFIQVINDSELSQDEADTLIGLFDNVIQTLKMGNR